MNDIQIRYANDSDLPYLIQHDSLVTEDMRVTANQFLAGVARHVLDVESTFLCSDLRVKQDVEQHVTQFVQDGGVFLLVDGIEKLAGLLDQIAFQRCVSCTLR